MRLFHDDLAQAILLYLSQRPAGEVHHLIGGILASEPWSDPLGSTVETAEAAQRAAGTDPVHSGRVDDATGFDSRVGCDSAICRCGQPGSDGCGCKQRR